MGSFRLVKFLDPVVEIGTAYMSGGIAAQISDNTSGTTGLISSGTLTLIGGNNITLSQNGRAN